MAGRRLGRHSRACGNQEDLLLTRAIPAHTGFDRGREYALTPRRDQILRRHRFPLRRIRIVSVARASRRRSGLRKRTEEAATVTTAPV